MNNINVHPSGLIGFLMSNGFEDAKSQHPNFVVLARPELDPEEAIIVPVNENAPHFFDLLNSAVVKAMRLLTAGYGDDGVFGA